MPSPLHNPNLSMECLVSGLFMFKPPELYCKSLEVSYCYCITVNFSLCWATHSSTLAWKIPWTEEPGGLQSMGSCRVGHDWTTSISLFTFMHWRRKWHPLQCSYLENPRDRGAWWAAVYGVAQSRTRLKRLSSSSSKDYRNWTGEPWLPETSVRRASEERQSGERRRPGLQRLPCSTILW